MKAKKTGHFSSVGVDLVELKKANDFYQSHKRNLSSFFSDEEMAYIRKNKKPHVNLAVLLAAKEAVFKSMGGAEGGLASFTDIDLAVILRPAIGGPKNLKTRSFGRHGDLRMTDDSRLPTGKAGLRGNDILSFVIKKDYVIAQCAGI